jgi:hypothetical protein
MAKPSDREFALHRKIRELEEQNRQKDLEIAQLKKKLERNEPTEYKPRKGKKAVRACPHCEAEIKVTDLPFGKLEICSKACGWRAVKRDD